MMESIMRVYLVDRSRGPWEIDKSSFSRDHCNGHKQAAEAFFNWFLGHLSKEENVQEIERVSLAIKCVNASRYADKTYLVDEQLSSQEITTFVGEIRHGGVGTKVQFFKIAMHPKGHPEITPLKQTSGGYTI
jgi:hypothetical protein